MHFDQRLSAALQFLRSIQCFLTSNVGRRRIATGE